MSFYREQKIRHAHKEHRCKVCGEMIKTGESYTRQVFGDGPDFSEVCLHNECHAMVIACLREYDGEEWDSGGVRDFIGDICRECPESEVLGFQCEMSPRKCGRVLEAIGYEDD
jgi:hypothetical protein